MNAIRLLLISTALALTAPGAIAEPFVVGFNRFHADAPSAEGGRLLFNELNCVRCHEGSTGLPERKGPQLSGIDKKFHREWVKQFLENPSETRVGTTMPSLIHGVPAADVDAILAYLASLKSPASKTKPPRHINSARGRDLFHSSGCVACHAPDPEFQPPEGIPKAAEFTYASIAFPEIPSKYSIISLVDFLKDPLKHRSDGRMPKFVAEDDDVVDVSGYLMRFEGSNGVAANSIEDWPQDAALAKRGEVLIREARCAACHELPKETAASVVPLSNMQKGCLALKPAIGIPEYNLSDQQRQSLELFLKKRPETPSDALVVSLSLEALNCTACHDRSGSGGPDAARKAYFGGDHNLGDTGRYPPPLTAVGRKLRPEWLEKVLSGDYRVRPYLHTKMPIFGKSTNGLASLLAKTDARAEKPLPGGDDSAGRKLLGTNGGIGCITCHRWGSQPALGIQALDLSNIGNRLTAEWLREYLINPAAYRPGTLMPSFWPNGTASNLQICGGNTDLQIASIYSFAKSANGEPEGFPQKSHGEFDLIPKDRPIVQRTFMEGVGSHAVLVGFPTGIHLAYDGKTGQPALAWEGKFFDAYNTWFSRFTPFEKPSGRVLGRWKLQDSATAPFRFEGYKLDKEGNPVFLLSHGQDKGFDRFEGIPNGFRRTLEWTSSSTTHPAPIHPEGAQVLEESSSQTGSRQFTYLWK